MELLANLGALMVAVALVALLKGDLKSLRIKNRKIALIILIIGVILAFLAVNFISSENELLNLEKTIRFVI